MSGLDDSNTEQPSAREKEAAVIEDARECAEFFLRETGRRPELYTPSAFSNQKHIVFSFKEPTLDGATAVVVTPNPGNELFEPHPNPSDRTEAKLALVGKKPSGELHLISDDLNRDAEPGLKQKLLDQGYQNLTTIYTSTTQL